MLSIVQALLVAFHSQGPRLSPFLHMTLPCFMQLSVLVTFINTRSRSLGFVWFDLDHGNYRGL